MLSLEAIRLGAIIVTVFHLLALAVNHYIGIARPLHYAGNNDHLLQKRLLLLIIFRYSVAIVTKRTATLCIIIMWIGPIAAHFAYFSSIEHQGFQVCQKLVIETITYGSFLVSSRKEMRIAIVAKYDFSHFRALVRVATGCLFDFVEFLRV